MILDLRTVFANENTCLPVKCELYKAILAENSVVGDGCEMGIGEDVPNDTYPGIYNNGLTVLAEDASIPAGIKVGKNTVITGKTSVEDYTDGRLESGKCLMKAGDQV